MEPKSQLPRKAQPSSCDSELKPSDVEISSIFSNDGLPFHCQFAIFFGGPWRSVGSWKDEADPAFSVFQDPGIMQAPVNCAERIQDGQTGFPGASDSKGSACNAGDLVWYLGWEDPLEEGMVNPSSILAWRIPMDQKSLVGSSQGVTKSWTRLRD